MFCHLLTSSGSAARSVSFVANQITLLRDSHWAAEKMLGITEYYLGFGFQKKLNEVSTRFCKSYSPEESVRGSPGTGRAMRRQGPIAPSGPDRARLRRRAPIGASGRVNCTKLAWPSFAGYKKPALSYNMWLGLVAARLHHGTHRAPVGARLRRRAPIHRRALIGPRLHRRAPIECTVGPRSGPDCAVGPRSSGPDSVGPRQLYQAGMAHSFAGYTKPALSCNMWLGLVGARLHHGTHRAPVGARLRRRAPLGPRLHQGAIALSLLALLYKVTTRHPQQNQSRCVPRAILGGCGAVGDIA